MKTYIALLRAINLGGHNKVSMVDLRNVLAGLGYDNVRSILQSGNLMFGAEANEAPRLERLLEETARAQLGLVTDFFVRNDREWGEIVSANPFPEAAQADPAHLIVMLLKGTPDRKHVTALEKAITGREVIRAKGNQVYIIYPDGIGRSKLTTALIEKNLGTRGTARNWNTILKLRTLAG